MNDLTRLANHYGSDKGTRVPGNKWPAHNYTDVYSAYLSSWREEEFSLLEVGLGVAGEHWDTRLVTKHNTGGASLKMWYDYFPKATIYGIDINDASFLDNDRITTFVADQGDATALQAVAEEIRRPFDVIIDDGSHRPDHQQVTLDVLFPYLEPDGLYFIEDLLANGKGDDMTGRMSCQNVLNTRRVLTAYRQTGRFPMPHALVDTSYLRQHIAKVAFHAPRFTIKWLFGYSLRQLVKPVAYHRTDANALAMIRKR